MKASEIVVRRSDLRPLDDDPIHIVKRYVVTTKSGKYLSVQPDGTVETRTEVGAWETGTLYGDKLVFEQSGDDYLPAVLVVGK